MRKKILQSGFFKAALLTAAPSLIMGALPLLGYAPWGRTSLEVVVFFVVVYSAIHVLVALLVMLVSRKWREYFPVIMLGVLLGGLAGLQAGTAMRMKAYELAGDRAAVLVSAIEHYIETTGAPPERLEQLVPDFVEAIPGRLPPLEIVTGEAALKGFYGNQWALLFKAGSGLNWDQLVYLPKQNYDQVESKTLLGRWAYLHE
ncbi:MAG: hypothetical protein KJ989_09755 [Gammaproteobacteria bacterium]|nr:hypothetical protein [Gammaproteobacteria bacterium]MBU2157515.1 hypothetical protein [Gammaproteobacteria bacterium]MBU2253365.1 hypothetical protein [Gammaproteobacteria bacterium]MBU2294475.1 hypothetical protein [Gammaproteobacteria bacterium]